MNPWIIIGALIALIGVGGAGFWYGDDYGTSKQQVADQKEFDKINAKLAEQKSEANAQYRKDQEDNIKLMSERDKLKTTLENQYAKNQQTTNRLHDAYSAYGLRFKSTETGGSGNCSGSTGSTSADSTSSSGTAIVQLPDTVTRDLRSLTYDADQLKDAYGKCYGYVQKIDEVCQLKKP